MPCDESGAEKGEGGQGIERRSEAPASPPAPGKSSPPSKRSLRGLDWFAFFIADVQTGFGPFIAVYLTAQAWTQVDIGLVLTIGGLAALVLQVPGGMLVDSARAERLVAGLAVVAISVSALVLALWPIFLVVLGSKLLHSGASCVLGPAMAAISLGLVGHAAIGERLGRNARFASIGNGLAAAVMGATGYFLSNQAVFLLTAALIIPAIWALTRIRQSELDVERAHGGPPREGGKAAGFHTLLGNRALIVLALCAGLFHLANAAMLPAVAGIVTMRSSQWATIMIGACIVVPQLVVVALAPWVGRQAQEWGRRPLLLIGLAALPIRGLLFAVVSDPYLIVAVQLLDGITAAILGVMVPLMIADVTRGTGRFNLAQGMVGTVVGVGASISTTLAGYMTDHFGATLSFCGMAFVAAAALLLALALMPETRPKD